MKLRSQLLILLITIILQAALVPFLAIKWFRPDLPLIVIIYLAVRRGPFVGVVFGFLAGIIVDALSAGFFGLSGLSYSLAAFVSGKMFYYDVSLPLFRWSLATATGIIVHGLVFAFFFSMHSSPTFVSMLIVHVLPATFYTWALGIVWAISPLYDKRNKVNF